MVPLIDAVEMWLPVIGFEGCYEISNLGRVKSVDRVHLLYNRHKLPYIRKLKGKVKAPSRSGPYDIIHLHKDGKCTAYLVHRLVALHFCTNAAGLPEVNHKDENKKNNAWWNLEWVTSSQNSLHSCYKTTGSKGGMSKLTEEDVIKIASLLQDKNVKQTDIAKFYGVTPHCIFRIKAGDNWAWLTGFGKEDKVHAPID